MPKKFLETDKREWLEFYESGKTETWIAKEHAKCDIRTVRRGIEEARRKQDAKVARAELLKEALRKHQDSLLEELEKILSALIVPSEDFAALSWYRNGDSIFTRLEILAERGEVGEISEPAKATRSQEDTLRRLLKQHLKNDRLWKVLAQWEKAYAAHLAARIAFQLKTVAILEEKTGYKLVDEKDIPPFLCSYTTGDLFYKTTLRDSFGVGSRIDLKKDIVVGTGEIRYLNLILAEVNPGNEEKTKVNLLAAFEQLGESTEVSSVVETHITLKDAVMRVGQVAEQIKLLGLITGQCEICRRLGI
jgi:hypothetical protein